MPVSLTLYGLQNCDSCRKARGWLTDNHIKHRFHDLRAEGLPAATLARWLDGLDWETLLNRRSSTWRQLPQADKAGVDANRARTLMLHYPMLVKRPVLEADGILQVGFSAPQYSAALAAART